MTEQLQILTKLSNRYGTGTDWVIAGGGNSSVKNEKTLWVKASGTTLGGITPEGFVEMNRQKLAAIWDSQYPSDPDTREQRALADLLAARVGGESAPRPSVETLMHDVFPHTFVLHTHPTLVNGLGCAVDGESYAGDLFGDRMMWIPTINPGYTLSVDIYRRLETWRKTHNGEYPAFLLMQNHGLVVPGNAVEEIDRIHDEIVAALQARVSQFPTDADEDGERDLADEVAAAYSSLPGLQEIVTRSIGRKSLIESFGAGVRAVDGAFSPDHIVYSGHRPCIVADATIADAIDAYIEAEGVAPKVVVLPSRGAVALGTTEKKAEFARLLFLDALKIAFYAKSFGGSLFMPPDQVEFIRGWEVEKFREKKSSG